MSPPNTRSLPRLLYIGDVPVENTYHGSLQLFRLLETYPKDRLLIMEAGNSLSASARRIEGVPYLERQSKLSRLRITRFAEPYFQAKMHLAALRAELLLADARRFRPEAILTVSHEVAWLSAAAIARRLGVPLHLVCHDEWGLEGWGARGPGAFKDRLFGHHYRAAASRLCVSPDMASDNESRFGIPGDVLYPCRSRSAPRVQPAASRLGSDTAIVCGYAGSIASGGLIQALDLMAQALEPIGGTLRIFGPFTAENGRSRGLSRRNIEFVGHADPLIPTLREKVDILYLPMSFADEDRANMRICFPSKLADYTLAGLPIVIMGPDYSSAAQWALSNPDAAKLLTHADVAVLREAVTTIAGDPVLRLRLSAAALADGDRYFSHAAAFEKLSQVFCRARLAQSPVAA